MSGDVNYVLIYSLEVEFIFVSNICLIFWCMKVIISISFLMICGYKGKGKDNEKNCEICE